MKTITTTGWVVTKTEAFDIKMIATFDTVEGWVNFHDRHPKMMGNGRRECSCCGKPWRDIKTGNVWICIMVNKINQCICDKCADKFEHLKITRNDSKRT